ncbi:Nucleus export protein BRR6 [Nosema bombycis CQ1]|uniref:Nucleus export protein BRR6 n=1 Tax=Nosema bombycis (strain CQ1 / CVCC 102059) TaxID=578461 RepID=R0MGV1_NOSB1|nr:Nucleus export protein BRR6 [Nosema bombycis CQ1]|eukprot:EOB12003.1 Nucleus export protein BRR6 [Nosema bombycis CQ1]
MTQMPMEVDLDFKWDTVNKKEHKQSEYLSPLIKRRLEQKKEDPLDCTEIVKYISKKRPCPIKECSDVIEHDTKQSHKYNSLNFLLYLPRLLTNCLLIFFDIIFMLLVIYAVLQLFIFIQKDLMHKIKEKKMELNQIVEMAKKNYEINKCERSTRVPALESVCNKWECTINNGSIGYTKVFFEVFGEVIDGFIRKFSVRSSIILIVFFVIYLKFRKIK